MVNLDKVKSSDLWYIVGYIASDGNLSIDGRHINITSKDREHLYLIRNALFLKAKIGKKSNGKEKKKIYSYLQFGDVNFYRYLINIGLFQNKSLTLQSLNINEKYFIDFLRGVIDGDGSVSTWIHRTNYHQQWSLRIYSASSKFAHWLYSEIRIVFLVNGKLHFYKRKDRANKIYIIKFGKKAAREILDKVYYKNCLSLERKFLQARLCLQDEVKMVN